MTFKTRSMSVMLVLSVSRKCSASPLRSSLPYCCGPGFSDATTYLRTSNWGNISVKEILACTCSTSPFHTPSFSKSNCWNS